MAIRMLDTGRDDQGRPHSLRVEAAFAEGAHDACGPEQIATWLTDEAWPDPPIDRAAEPQVSLLGTAPQPAMLGTVTACWSGRRKLGIIVGRPATFRCSLFEVVIDAESAQPVSSNPTMANRAVKPSARPISTTNGLLRGSRRTRSIAGLLLGVVIAALPLSLWLFQTRSNLHRVDAQKQSLLEEKTELDGEVSKLRREAGIKDRLIDSLNKERDGWAAVGEAFGKDEPAELKAYIHGLEINSKFTLDNELKGVRQQRDLFEGFIEEFHKRASEVLSPYTVPQEPSLQEDGGATERLQETGQRGE